MHEVAFVSEPSHESLGAGFSSGQLAADIGRLVNEVLLFVFGCEEGFDEGQDSGG